MPRQLQRLAQEVMAGVQLPHIKAAEGGLAPSREFYLRLVCCWYVSGVRPEDTRVLLLGVKDWE